MCCNSLRSAPVRYMGVQGTRCLQCLLTPSTAGLSLDMTISGGRAVTKGTCDLFSVESQPDCALAEHRNPSGVVAEGDWLAGLQAKARRARGRLGSIIPVMDLLCQRLAFPSMVWTQVIIDQSLGP